MPDQRAAPPRSLDCAGSPHILAAAHYSTPAPQADRDPAHPADTHPVDTCLAVAHSPAAAARRPAVADSPVGPDCCHTCWVEAGRSSRRAVVRDCQRTVKSIPAPVRRIRAGCRWGFRTFVTCLGERVPRQDVCGAGGESAPRKDGVVAVPFALS
jgi:hypothetical protein